MHRTTKAYKTWIRICEWGSATSMLLLIITVFLQVTSRFLLPVAPPWTEELARTAFVYLVAFGAGAALKSHAFVYLETVVQLMPPRVRGLVQRITTWTIFVFSVFCLYFSFGFLRQGAFETSPALGISMIPAFLSITLLFGSIALAMLGNAGRSKRTEPPAL
jgi:TRAP-type transport system small permease protein